MSDLLTAMTIYMYRGGGGGGCSNTPPPPEWKTSIRAVQTGNCHLVYYPFRLIAQPWFSGLGLGLGSRIRVRVSVYELGLVQGRGNGSFWHTVVDQMGVDKVTINRSNTPLWIRDFVVVACLLTSQRGWWYIRQYPYPLPWSKCHVPVTTMWGSMTTPHWIPPDKNKAQL